MDVSLVIATRDRAGKLGTALRKAARIDTEHDWELIVVDNASTDETPAVIAAFASSASVPVRSEFEPTPGLGRALNRGCRAARGPIIATTDDDCYPEPDYVDALCDVFGRHDVGWAGGRMVRHDPDHARVSVVDRPEAELLPPGRFPAPGFVGGGNLAFRRELFRDLGGFDERLGAGTPFPCEDIEFCARASERGWRGGFFPGPTVRHDHGRRTDRDVARLRRSYAGGRGAYYAKVLLEMPALRVQCLKHVYWQLGDRDAATLFRVAAGALRYLGVRTLGGRSPDGA